MSEALRFPAGLYGVTPDWDDAARLVQATRAAARGGMTALQFRHKTAPTALRRDLAEQLCAVCRELGVKFLVNDDWRLARAVGADGVHLGRDDEDPAVARAELGKTMLIGVSVYADPVRAARLLEHDVDYIAFGAMFSSSTKPKAPPAQIGVLAEGLALCRAFAAPRPAVVAIGGIGPETAGILASAGADSIAVVGSLFLAPDIEGAARTLSAPFKTSDPVSR